MSMTVEIDCVKQHETDNAVQVVIEDTGRLL